MPQVSRLLWSAKILLGVLARCWWAPSRTVQRFRQFYQCPLWKGLWGKSYWVPPVGDWAFLGAEGASYSSCLRSSRSCLKIHSGGIIFQAPDVLQMIHLCVGCSFNICIYLLLRCASDPNKVNWVDPPAPHCHPPISQCLLCVKWRWRNSWIVSMATLISMYEWQVVVSFN